MNRKAILLRCLALAAIVIAIVLEALPFGAVLNFIIEVDGNKSTKPEYFSYFDFTPFGNANFAPLITAVMSIILAAASITLLFVKRKSPKFDFAFVAVAITTAIISLSPVFFGLKDYTITGLFITLSLAAAAILHAFSLYVVDNNAKQK